jgi:hypothetical protein
MKLKILAPVPNASLIRIAILNACVRSQH